MIQHFLITRFNIKANYGCKLRNPENDPMKRILEEGYLEQRFNIFERFTLQSIKQQTNQNFTWLILFHKRTPKKFLEKIKQLKEEFDFKDLYFEDDERFSFSDYCNSNEYYITSRIDNDDMIEKDYIDRVQQYAKQNLHECILSFDKGIKYDINLNKKYAYERKDNHFLSMIGKKRDCILQYNHAKILNSGKEIVFLDSEKPMWIEIIHDSNVINRIKKDDVELERDEDIEVGEEK